MSTDVDMEGRSIDRAMELASRIVHKRATDQPTFAGLWLDTRAREIHIAFTGSDVTDTVAALQAALPAEIRLRAHAFAHSMSELDDLTETVRKSLDREGWCALHGVGVGVRVRTNRVQLQLKDTTPPEVEHAIRSQYAGTPLDIELTTYRWVAQ